MAIRPYLLAETPTSSGRAFLPRAFAHWCALHHGLSPEQIDAAFAGSDATSARRVLHDARLLGELIASGRIESWARPMGGGVPARLGPDAWELDDFEPRFSAGALDPRRPYDRDAEPTHWIFLELDGFNAVVEASCADALPPQRREIRQQAPRDASTGDERAASGVALGEGLVRLPEVKSRTGLSRSTIYRRMEAGRFPTTVEMDGNVAAWRRSELEAWLADPR